MNFLFQDLILNMTSTYFFEDHPEEWGKRVVNYPFDKEYSYKRTKIPLDRSITKDLIKIGFRYILEYEEEKENRISRYLERNKDESIASRIRLYIRVASWMKDIPEHIKEIKRCPVC